MARPNASKPERKLRWFAEGSAAGTVGAFHHLAVDDQSVRRALAFKAAERQIHVDLAERRNGRLPDLDWPPRSAPGFT